MEKQITIEQLLEENKDVLQRLATCGGEYYTAEQMKQSFENNKKLSKKRLTNAQKYDIIKVRKTKRGKQNEKNN